MATTTRSTELPLARPKCTGPKLRSSVSASRDSSTNSCNTRGRSSYCTSCSGVHWSWIGESSAYCGKWSAYLSGVGHSYVLGLQCMNDSGKIQHAPFNRTFACELWEEGRHILTLTSPTPPTHWFHIHTLYQNAQDKGGHRGASLRCKNGAKQVHESVLFGKGFQNPQMD